MRRILHLTGSPTDPGLAELSRLYAADCLAATADPQRYEFLIADVRPGGQWCFPDTLTAAAIVAAPTMTVSEAIAVITDWAPDVVLPQMFCPQGMTSYRALFEVLGVPVVGNRADTMALGADKAACRAVAAAEGVAVPDGYLIRAGGPAFEPAQLPVVVKPVAADNSFGVSLVRTLAEWDVALSAARAEGPDVLVEQFVPLGREVRCAVLERDGELLGLPLEEYAVDPQTAPIRTAADKLRRGTGDQLELVAKEKSRAWIVDPADPLTAPVQEAARAAFRALGCRQYGLFDFRIDPAGRPWFLEAGLYCSFARQSVVVMMAEAASIPLSVLFEECVSAAATDRGPAGAERVARQPR
ncbi:hypothetical protein [Branchiibius sp. NY16-3462-2]|uniref:D-alanine--D-alanine ligase family protein n=1 Tax=Branchiibius sp. NY16-3462-2 TaxID=1807500 RepID=UPI0007994199|nr:hypothetical protein [Branchiibius sp. NY16-3462-2]KYH43526.1 D-alanine--D-alanine ligase [Branchiibius sp. NY16-3462-2]